MFQVLAHTDLPHQFVLVSVHSCQLTHVGEDVLQAICQLKHRSTIREKAKHYLKKPGLPYSQEQRARGQTKLLTPTHTTIRSYKLR